jgi:hypothetical protein
MSVESVNFLWKGTTWPDAGVTGAGHTGGYWNHADNWYERVDGFSQGGTGENSADDGFYYKPATRFPRGNDIVLLKGYQTDTHYGLVTDGPLVGLEWGGVSGGVWFGATGGANSGASGNTCIFTVEETYFNGLKGIGSGANTTYYGLTAGTTGPGGFGGFSADGRAQLQLKVSTYTNNLNGDAVVRVNRSEVDNFLHSGRSITETRGSTVGNYILDQGPQLVAYQGYATFAKLISTGENCVITNSFTSRGERSPFIDLNAVGTSGGDHTSIAFVNLHAQNHLSNVNLRCNIDKLDFRPMVGAGSGNSNKARIRSSENSSTGLGRVNIREITQGWGPYSSNDGSTNGSIIEICCGATIGNYRIDSGTFQLNGSDISATDEITILDGTINKNAIVKGQHPVDLGFSGFRIGATSGSDPNGLTGTGFLVLNTDCDMQFGQGIYVQAQYAGPTGAGPALQAGMGSGK